MNKYRAVQDTDEYDTEYQCMSCRQTWAARYFGANYCGFCGVKFEGQLECRPHDVPRWKWDRWGNEMIPWDIALRREQQQRRWPRPVPETLWDIESAYSDFLARDGESAWRVHETLRGAKCTGKFAKQRLDQLRADEEEDRDSNGTFEWPGRVLFRVRRVPVAERTFHALVR